MEGFCKDGILIPWNVPTEDFWRVGFFQFHQTHVGVNLCGLQAGVTELFLRQVGREVESLESNFRPLCLAFDDTILRKGGMTIPGTAYRKNPLGPPFSLNQVLAQCRLQLSPAVTDVNNEVRMIPIDYPDVI